MNSGNSHHHPMQQRHHQSFGLVQEDNAHIFLSRQNALQRIHTNRIRASDPYPAARSHTTAQAYIGDPGKRWTTIGNKIKQIFAVNTTLNDSHAKKPQRRSIRQRFHNMKLNCQNMYCRRYDLEKVCTSQSMSTAEKDVCTACYPRKNLELIRDRCKVRRARSDQVLYRACILVGFSAMVAVLLYMVRSYRHSRRSQTSRNLTAETFSSSTLPMATTTSIAASSYSGLDMRTKHSHADGTQSFGTNAFMTERRPRNLGFFNREPRRRIRDVFDLESLGSIREGSGILKERVPVLPRAPNASLRGQSVTKNTKQAPQGASDEDHGSCSG
ncbi:hypothetical protein BDV26DRAFT_268271 [Aspergillus bertholletiae]|uniref:Uncharacterized protein n=1 Tax=Aspergillus bertholletiae TaxID=1226010 RepID=A0A5N7AZD3_9EURO|nr:hypothetical protein BDV26DRAFT_268271 [Aspergillus bertholletiae]